MTSEARRLWRNIGISALKILAFLGLWAALTAGAVMSVVGLGGEQFYEKVPFRVGLEVVLTFAILMPLIVMARFIDKRPLSTIGFASKRLVDVLLGAIVGAFIFMIPIGALMALGAARFAPDLAGFSLQGVAIGVFVCLFNVTTQELLVRSYMFQELLGQIRRVAGDDRDDIVLRRHSRRSDLARRARPDRRRQYFAR